MSDLIDRHAAIDALCSICGQRKNCDESLFRYYGPQDEQVIPCPEHYMLATLPSTGLERKTGKWIHNRDEDGWHMWLECSECGTREDNTNAKFCPNCGSYNGGDVE